MILQPYRKILGPKIYKYLLLSVFINFVFPSIVFAESWGYVLAYYNFYKAEYPSPKNKVWLEKTPTSYRIWVRPQSSSYYRRKTIVTSGIDWINENVGGYACTGDSATISLGVGVAKWAGTVARYEYNFCDGTLTKQENMGGSFGTVSALPCWTESYFPSSSTFASCKSQDMLLGEFVVDEDDCWEMLIEVGNRVAYGSSAGCGCTPNGTEFSDSSSNMCYYSPLYGDPALFVSGSPPVETFLTGDTPGDIIIKNSEVSPPITNPDNTVTQTETVTYPDNTQDISTSVTTDNGDNTKTIVTNTDRYLTGGGIIPNYRTATTTIYPDSSTRTNLTGVDGVTSVTLTGTSGVSSTTTTSGSGLTTTTTTSGGTGTTTTTAGGGGGGGEGSGASVWEDPPASYVIPSLTADPVFDTVVDVPDVTPDYNLLESAVNNLISSNPVVSAVQGTRINLSGADCSFEAEAFGKQFVFDFCGTASYLNLVGVGIVGLAAVRSVFIAMGIDRG